MGATARLDSWLFWDSCTRFIGGSIPPGRSFCTNQRIKVDPMKKINGNKCWSGPEIERLKTCYLRGESWLEIQRIFARLGRHRTIDSLKGKAKDIGITYKRWAWREDEDRYLRDNRDKPNVDIAKMLGRPASSVGARKQFLGLSPPRKPRKKKAWKPSNDPVSVWLRSVLPTSSSPRRYVAGKLIATLEV